MREERDEITARCFFSHFNFRVLSLGNYLTLKAAVFPAAATVVKYFEFIACFKLDKSLSLKIKEIDGNAVMNEYHRREFRIHFNLSDWELKLVFVVSV